MYDVYNNFPVDDEPLLPASLVDATIDGDVDLIHRLLDEGADTEGTKRFDGLVVD